MHQGSSKTPCRRVGLSKTPNRSPVVSRTELSTCSRDDTVSPGPRSHSNHKPTEIKLCSRAGSQALSETIHSSIASCSTSAVLSEAHHCQSKRPLNLEVASEEVLVSNAKKQRVQPTGKTPTYEDLFALRRRIASQEKQLQELRQAQIICKKHDPKELADATQRWLQGCQDALQDLLSTLNSNGHCIDMEKLLHELGIPSALVQFNEDDQDFE